MIAGPAQKLAEVDSDPEVGPVTLIGFVETNEGTAANMLQERKYNYLMSNDSNPVPTTFVP